MSSNIHQLYFHATPQNGGNFKDSIDDFVISMFSEVGKSKFNGSTIEMKLIRWKTKLNIINATGFSDWNRLN